jgi:hypothetical protein
MPSGDEHDVGNKMGFQQPKSNRPAVTFFLFKAGKLGKWRRDGLQIWSIPSNLTQPKCWVAFEAIGGATEERLISWSC